MNELIKRTEPDHYPKPHERTNVNRRLQHRYDNNRTSRIKTTILFVTVLLTVLFNIKTYAQDPVYSQAFLSPIYLNPAATGCGDYDLRFSAIYRRQWWSIPSTMNYSAFSVDKFLPGIHSGVGLIVTNSSEGYINKNGFYATYSYNICNGTSYSYENPRWFFTGGLQFGLAQTRINYSNLVFADQLNVYGYIPNSVSEANLPINNGKMYPDFAAGLFFNYNIDDYDRLLIGLSDHHLNTPDESLTFSSGKIRSILPMLYSGNVLYTHTNPNQTWSYSIAALGYSQAYNSSFQVGGEVTQNEVNVSLGMWYRGSVNFSQINTFCVTLALNILGGSDNRDKVRVGVDEDAEVGRNAYSYTTGSSEIGFVWDHNSNSDGGTDDPCKPIIDDTRCPSIKQ
jgi:type IX secretion system PorP/SprF family membrane protein